MSRSACSDFYLRILPGDKIANRTIFEGKQKLAACFADRQSNSYDELSSNAF